MPRIVPLLALVWILSALTFAACGGGEEARAITGVTIEPVASDTPSGARTVPIGGKPATPPAIATATPATATEAPAEEPPATATEVVPDATATAAPRASDGSIAPVEGRWIEVDVTNFVVRLMDGARVVAEIGPVGVGEQVDTGEYASTQTGLFYVNSKIEDLAYDPPYDTYISHWVGFDEAKANGFHSFLKDAQGVVVDPSTGRVSNGCIRTGEPEQIFAYAEIGMPVWVHW